MDSKVGSSYSRPAIAGVGGAKARFEQQAAAAAEEEKRKAEAIRAARNQFEQGRQVRCSL